MIDERVARTLDVSAAMATGKAIVALESTVIAQGLPWPENITTARAVERAVHDAGAVPATIAILGGTVRIGLTDSELTQIAASSSQHQGHAFTTQADNHASLSLTKANRRDLAAILAGGRCAATTVSATLWIARRFSLEPMIMATGGLGGVHRDASVTFDVSTDLDELARADGAVVVCSGLKSILDVPASLEALETRGVLVVGYRTDVLPGFLALSSGLPLEHRVETPAEAAAVILAHRDLKLPERSSWPSRFHRKRLLIQTRFRRPSTALLTRPPGTSAVNPSRRFCSTRSGRRRAGRRFEPIAHPGGQRSTGRRGCGGTGQSPLKHDQSDGVDEDAGEVEAGGVELAGRKPARLKPAGLKLAGRSGEVEAGGVEAGWPEAAGLSRRGGSRRGGSWRCGSRRG